MGDIFIMYEILRILNKLVKVVIIIIIVVILIVIKLKLYFCGDKYSYIKKCSFEIMYL